MALAWSWVPHFWRDERSTIRTTHLPWNALWPFLKKRDAVHGAYYVLLHPWLAGFGSSQFAARFPSAIAVALAAAGVTVIAYYLEGPRAGIISGLVMALLPVTSHYGMEARSYALTCALVTWAGYCLLRASAADGWWGWWVGYGVLLFASGGVFMYALLIGLAHSLTLVFARVAVRVQLLVLGLVGIAISPLVLLASRQSGQVSWISRVIVGNAVDSPLSWVISVPQPHGGLSSAMSLLVRCAAILLGALLWVLVGKAVISLWPRCEDRVDVLALALPWLLLPAAFLIMASIARPMFVERYVFFSAPAFALLIGYALAQLKQRTLIAGVAVLVLLAAPLWIADRQPFSKSGVPKAKKVALMYSQPVREPGTVR